MRKGKKQTMHLEWSGYLAGYIQGKSRADILLAGGA